MRQEDYIPLDSRRERAYLIGVEIKRSHPLLSVEDSLKELALLADTAGIAVVGQTYQRVDRIHPSTLIGSGKVEEIKETIATLEAETVIFDDELSPRHQRELDEIFGEAIKVLDRSALILDIFAQHASTHEGRLQVELAQYEYRLPRLTRQWTHLARQAGGGSARGGTGGVGLRGPGETQLEVDRREISRKIAKLKSELELVRAHRGRLRQQRQKTAMPVVALVGYTNAGKSTLLKTITGADVYIADQLFATLDTTTRRVDLPGGRSILLSDTVGFIQKLPTTLIEAFQATLEGIKEADLLLHVVDSSHPNLPQQVETVEDTLAEIEVPRIPRLLVLNKADLRSTNAPLPELDLDAAYQASVIVSALNNTGIEALLQEIEKALKDSMVAMRLFLPYNKGDIISLIHSRGVVDHEEHTATGVFMDVHVPIGDIGWLERYRHTSED